MTDQLLLVSAAALNQEVTSSLILDFIKTTGRTLYDVISRFLKSALKPVIRFDAQHHVGSHLYGPLWLFLT